MPKAILEESITIITTRTVTFEGGSDWGGNWKNEIQMGKRLSLYILMFFLKKILPIKK